MVAYLTKSDASEGFNQIMDFLNGSYIKYALTMNPNIYVSCIKQFWNTVAIKHVNDVTRLQALVDKKVVVTEAAIREVLCLDDAEGVDCLPNEEIVIELVRMGYEKPSTKLTFYKAFFSSQWKFRIHTILQCMRKGFSGVDTPLFEGMLVAQEIEEKGDADEHVEEVTAGDAAHRDDSTAHGEVPTVTQEPSIPSPTPTTPPPQPPQDLPLISQVKKLEKGNKVRVLKLRRLQKVGTSQRVDTSDDTMIDDESNQGRMIAEMDKCRGKEEDEAFQLLKQKLCSASILALPEGMKDFVVYCDASLKGCGVM
nr:putative reverse transcriptase domain-containing protein [Tanacetum cinerariifolium]